MAETFGIACHELVSLDFRCGSTTDSEGYPQFRPLSGVKRTSNLGGSMSLPSQKRKMANQCRSRASLDL